MKKWIFDLIQNFVVGGLIISSVSYIATFMDPLLASIWWAFPLSLIPSIYYMHKEGKSYSEISKFTFTTTFALGVLFITTYAMSYFYKKTNDFWTPIFKSAIIWVICGFVYYILIKHFKLDKYFL